MSDILLDVRGMSKYFPVYKGFLRRQVATVRAVEKVSFQLKRGQTLALVGESGCGKTTAARTLLRLIEPDAGEAFLNGTDIFKLSSAELQRFRPKMQIVFQDPFSSLNPRHTVGQLIGRPLLLHGRATPATVDDQVKEALVNVGLQPGYISRYPHEFSGGQRQRLGIARAIALRPELVVCDEAVSALDVSVRAQVLNLLIGLQQQAGLSYLFVTHDLSVVQHFADEVLVMYLGRVMERAPRISLFQRAYHPYTEALLSAAPSPHPDLRRQRILLTGDVPSPLPHRPVVFFRAVAPK